MSVRIVMIDYINPTRSDPHDICTGCRRHDRKSGTCAHFGSLSVKPGTKSTHLRHHNCIRAEERCSHASHSLPMMMGDFDTETSAIHDTVAMAMAIGESDDDD